MSTEIKFPFYAKASIVFIGLFAFVIMLFFAQGIIIPIIYATLIAIVLSPVIDYMVRKKVNRLFAISITVISFVSIILLITLLISSQMMQLSNSIPTLIQKFHQLLSFSESWTSHHFNISTAKIDLWIAEKNVEIIKESTSLIGRTIINTGSLLIVLVLIPVYIFMILLYQPLIIEFIHKLFSAKKQTDLNEVLTATKKIIQSYLVGLLLEALIIATLNSASLLILGIEYAILLGVIGAIVNVIPYIGGIVAVTLPMLIAITTKTPSYAMLVLASYVLIQFIDNHFIIPKVVASKVKINALISIIVVLVGGALWGLPGMFISIPLTAIIKIIFDHVDELKPWGYLLGNIETKLPKQK